MTEDMDDKKKPSLFFFSSFIFLFLRRFESVSSRSFVYIFDNDRESSIITLLFYLSKLGFVMGVCPVAVGVELFLSDDLWGAAIL